MTSDTIPDFTVTVVGPRLKIEWADDVADYWFVATADGHDTITQIHGNIGRPNQRLIVRRDRNMPGSRGLSYHGAQDPEYEPLVEVICATIARDKLATKAWASARAERAAKDAETVRTKAARVHELMEQHGIAGAPGKADDDALAAFYDAVQNSAI